MEDEILKYDEDRIYSRKELEELVIDSIRFHNYELGLHLLQTISLNSHTLYFQWNELNGIAETPKSVILDELYEEEDDDEEI